MRIIHTGTELNVELSVLPNQKAFTIQANGNEQTVKLNDKSRIEGIMPSVEGTTVFCFLKSGKTVCFDTLSGEVISDEELLKRKVHIYV